MGPDGALGEHIRLALESPLLVQHFQRAQQAVAGILPEGKAVAPAGDPAILGGVVIIEPV